MASDSPIDALTTAFNVDVGLSDEPIFTEHPRFSGYKNVGRAAQRQKERRQEYLERQKNHRAEIHDRARAMFDDNYFEENEKETDFTGGEEAMEADETNVFQTHKRLRLHRRYQNQLMFSEWLIDIPNELHETWAMVTCPKGKRCLVVAKDGWTQVFNKVGLLIFESMTGLPGGSSVSKHSTTIIDAIRLAADPKTYYILDVISAQGMSFLEVNALSRFAMIQAIVEEISINTSSLRPKDQKKAPTFLVPPLCRCTQPKMTATMSVDHPFEVDGLLFYNDNGWYTAGYTPLVGWLKPWMLPEVLGVPILDKYKIESPKNKSIHEFVEDYNNKHNHKFVHGKPWEIRSVSSPQSTITGSSSQDSEA